MFVPRRSQVSVRELLRSLLHQAAIRRRGLIPISIHGNLQPIPNEMDNRDDRWGAGRGERRAAGISNQLHNVAIRERSGAKRAARVLNVDRRVRIAIVSGQQLEVAIWIPYIAVRVFGYSSWR